MNAAHIGCKYTLTVMSHGGDTLETATCENLVPIEGLNHMLSSEFKGGSQVTSWYIAPFGNDYTPLATDTAALFPGALVASEITAYTQGTRVDFTSGTPSGGVLSNTGAEAEFTFPGETTVRGLFMSSVATKGATSGVLISAAKLSSALTIPAASTLKVSADFTLTSS